MAGGKGTRMDLSDEKLLLQYKKPVIFHVIDARALDQRGIETLTTPGNGYTNDLNFLLQKMDGFVFVTSGDLPLLDKRIIQVITEKFNSENIWTSFLVSKKFLNSLGLESSLLVNSDNIECTHTGISIIDANKIKNLNSVKENYVILDDKRIAFNLNTKKDYELLSSS